MVQQQGTANRAHEASRETDPRRINARRNDIFLAGQSPRQQLAARFEFLRGLCGLTPRSRRSKSFDFEPYSYRSASTGSSFDARIAGTIPLITPTTSNTMPERNTVINEIRR